MLPLTASIAGIFLVDRRGWVLLQERDEHAPTAPNQWGIVGGHVEAGEPWPQARDRELHEETGLSLADVEWHLWHDGPVEHPTLGQAHYWLLHVALVDLTDSDVVCGEGRQIVFVDPRSIEALPLAESTRYFLPRFLASELYQSLLTP